MRRVHGSSVSSDLPVLIIRLLVVKAKFDIKRTQILLYFENKRN